MVPTNDQEEKVAMRRIRRDMRRPRLAPLALACLAAAFLPFAASAQTWPQRPVKMIVPFPAGGPTDVMTRILSDKLSQALGQPVVVDNKPGAGGTIGSDLVAKSPADGYTLLMATGSTHSVGPYLGKVPYDPQKDFTPIVYVGYGTNILLVSPKLGVSTVQELIDGFPGAERVNRRRGFHISNYMKSMFQNEVEFRVASVGCGP